MNNPSSFITSLAYHLGLFDTDIGREVADVVKQRPDIARYPFTRQFDELIGKPLKAVVRLKDAGPLIVLVDGMDECKRSDKRWELLDVLSTKLQSNAFPFLRVVVASRPDDDLEKAFSSSKPWITSYRLDRPSDNVDQDIHRYFEVKFRDIQDDRFHAYCNEHDALRKLTDRASGLFIWADTAYRFIKHLPVRRIITMLGTSIPSKALDALTTLYATALDSILSESADDDDIKDGVLTVLGTTIVTGEPFTVEMLNRLFFSEASAYVCAGDFLSKIASVATVDEKGRVHLLHKSFDDFLTDGPRAGQWYIEKELWHKRMISQCVERLGQYYGALDGKYDGSASPDVKYAIYNWTGHLVQMCAKA